MLAVLYINANRIASPPHTNQKAFLNNVEKERRKLARRMQAGDEQEMSRR